MARTAPDAYTLLKVNAWFPFQPILAGGTPLPEALVQLVQNQNHAHRSQQKVYLVQPCQTLGEENYLTALVTAALVAAPDLLYVWRLRRLLCDAGIRLTWHYRTTGGSVGFKVWAIDAAGSSHTIYQNTLNSAGVWATFDVDYKAIFSDVTDPEAAVRLCFGVYEGTASAELDLKQVVVQSSPQSSTALVAGIRDSGFVPNDIGSFAANAPLSSALMQQLIDNITALRADKAGTFARWCECLAKSRSNDYLRPPGTSSSYQRVIGPVPFQYMPGASTISWAACGYQPDPADRFRVYTGYELETLGIAGVTSYAFTPSAATVDPTDATHWHTRTAAVKETTAEMGSDVFYIDYLAAASRDMALVSFSVEE